MTASPPQVWDAAYADYTSGQYDLAVLGFEAYIRTSRSQIPPTMRRC
jgi:hypothetical protein